MEITSPTISRNREVQVDFSRFCSFHVDFLHKKWALE